MERLIPALYGEFGKYKNKEQMFPSIVDGLLPVYRRYLLGLHTFARKEKKVTAEVIGGVVANWHPHALSEGPLEYLYQNGFATGEGQWGDAIGIERLRCAAMRYTKIKASEFIEDLAFKYVDYVTWDDGELKPEPKYIPTMIPICLMGRDELIMMGFGFKTQLPVYKKEDLIKRLMYLLGQTTDKPTIIPNIFQCDVVDGEYEEILTTGRGKIDIHGRHQIDNMNKKIVVSGWSPRIGFDVLLNRIDNYKGMKLLSNADIGWRDDTNERIGTSVEFSILRQRNIDAIFIKMKEAVVECLKGSHSYSVYAIEDNQIKLVGIDAMLLAAYNNFKQAFTNYLNQTIVDNNEKIKELIIIRDIRPHIAVLTGKENDPEKAFDELSKMTGHKADDIRQVASKYVIRKLLSVNVDIKGFEDDNLKHQNSLLNVDAESIGFYSSI